MNRYEERQRSYGYNRYDPEADRDSNYRDDWQPARSDREESRGGQTEPQYSRPAGIDSGSYYGEQIQQPGSQDYSRDSRRGQEPYSSGQANRGGAGQRGQFGRGADAGGGSRSGYDQDSARQWMSGGRQGYGDLDMHGNRRPGWSQGGDDRQRTESRRETFERGWDEGYREPEQRRGGSPDGGQDYSFVGFSRGGGTRWTGDEGPYAGRGPRGYTRSDERIREDVSECLMRAGQVDASDIEVDVKNGEVTLKGTVADRWQKRAAEDTVESVHGVRDIDNKLKVDRGAGYRASEEEPPRKRAEDAFTPTNGARATEAAAASASDH